MEEILNRITRETLFTKLDIQRFASSFSMDSAVEYQGRKLTLYTSQVMNVASNTSTIYWELVSHGGSSARYATGPTTVIINGVQVYYKQWYGYSHTSFPVATGSVSGSLTVAHSTNGAKTITCTLSTAIYTSTVSTATQNWELDTIPRGTTINSFTRDNVTLNSFRVNWSSAHMVDRVEYSLSGGSWTLGQSGDRTSGNFTIGGLNPNTQYSIRIRVRRKDTGIWTESGTAYVTTLNIATLTSVPDNIDIDKPFTIDIARNGANNVSVGIYATDSQTEFVAYRLVSGTSYTFNLTASEKNALFGDMINTSSKKYRLYLNTNDNAYRTTIDRTFKIVDADPTFSNFTFTDTNSVTVALTGNNQRLIRGYSDVRATITTANRATANKSATMASYYLNILNTAGIQDSKPYSSTASVILNIPKVNSNIISVYAVDSRNNATKVEKTANMVEYIEPIVIGGSTERIGGVGTNTKLKVNGRYFNQSFGAETNNVTATYRYKETSLPNFSSPIPITLTKTGENFSFDGEIAGDLGANGFNSAKSYNIEVTIKDELSPVVFNTIIGSGKPALAIAKKGVSVNAQFDSNLDEGLQVYGKLYLNKKEIKPIDLLEVHPVGSTYISINSNKPADMFGGTWIQLTDRFLIGAGGLYSLGATGGHVNLQSHDHTFSFTTSWADLKGTSTNSFFYGGQSNTSNGIVHTYMTSGRQYQATTTATNSWQQLHINASHSHTGSGTTASSGSGNAQNMPPYRAVNIWYRSA